MTDATSATPAPDALASVLADAPFVRLVATDDGDALAATECSRVRSERPIRRSRRGSQATRPTTRSATRSQ